MSDVSTINLNLSGQIQYRLNEINKIESYFTTDIQKREIMSKNLSKYIATFDYFDKILIFLSAASWRIYIISYGSSCRKSKCSFNLIFSLTARTIQKLLKITRNNKKKHNKTVLLAWSKLNSINISGVNRSSNKS